MTAPYNFSAGAKRCGLPSVFVAVCWFLSGCTAAYNARTVNSPDWKYAARCRIRGSFGRSYLADTRKKIVVSIFELSPNANERSKSEEREASQAGVWRGSHNPGAIVMETNKLLFQKEYWVKGSDLNWNSEWGRQDDLTIVFYDYGANVEGPYTAENVAPKRFLQTIHYEFDPDLGIYKEAAP